MEERVRLYSLPISNPGHTARLMLEFKGIEFKTTHLLAGYHPPLVRMLGFRHGTVPAMRVDGRRVQGSREISRELDRIAPDPPLFPSGAKARLAVENAELWGEEELQAVPRRIMRWAGVHQQPIRRWTAAESGVPFPGMAARTSIPIAAALARGARATKQSARADVEGLEATLAHVDKLIAGKVIGGRKPNAADFQIAPSVRLLMSCSGLEPLMGERPATKHARRILPEFPGPIPVEIPDEWIESAKSAAAA